jgi:hydroxyacylglutathione hydrolase
MFFQHIYDKTLAQASYLLGCQKTGEAIVIDAKRDVDTYLEIAKQNHLRITHITETHIHADFLSGSRELAALTNAKMYLSDEGGPDWQYQFEHQGLRHGDLIKVGNLSLKVFHTPGHTPESITFLLTDHPASEEPVMMFTGDFIFVGDIGRPDLLEKAAGIKGTQELGAEQMFQSVRHFRSLPDFIQVWPGHGAGSACGKALGAVPSSTLGYEKLRNWAFQYGENKTDFVAFLLSDQPEPPKYFAQMKSRNKEPRNLLTEVPKHPKLNPNEVLQALQNGVTIIDTRHKSLFEKGFIPGTINIQNNNSLATWAGWFLNYDTPFLIIAEEKHMEEITRKLMRIGLDHIVGYIDNVHWYEEKGYKLQVSSLVDANFVEHALKSKELEIFDVRGLTEYQEGHIPGSKHLFLGTLPDHLSHLPKDKPFIISCQSGDRTAIGSSLLFRLGYSRVMNYAGGFSDWQSKGLEVSKD